MERKRLRISEVRPATIALVKTLLDRRKPTQQSLETVEGKLTALDTVTNAFQLSVKGQKPRVRGTVMAFHMPWMRERLGHSVTLEGVVERRSKQLVSLTVHRVVETDDD